MTDQPNTAPHPCEAQPLEPMPSEPPLPGDRYSHDAEWKWSVSEWVPSTPCERDIIARLRAALHAKDAECERLKEGERAADARIAELERLKASGWRDAGEVNPMYAGQYLIKTTDDERAAWGWWDGEDWLAVTMVAGRITSIVLRNIVTHWQPLPDSPKEATVQRWEPIIDDGKFVGFEPCERGDWVKWSAIRATGVEEADDANQD